MQRAWQLGIAAFVVIIAIVYAIGAMQLPSEGGYAGIGSSFVPWVVSILLFVLAALLIYQALSGGFRNFTDEVANIAADYRGALWVSAGVLAMAALITRIGFVPAATILFICVARGFGSRVVWRDALIGAALVFPVFWLFTLVLDVNLPRLFNDWL
ncbi:MAG: tripartite tricarboxylate transporter TctB family protein [Casimicrobium sp.]